MHDESLDETGGWTGVKPVQQWHSGSKPDVVRIMSGKPDKDRRMWTGVGADEKAKTDARRWGRGMTQGGPGGYLVGVRGNEPQGEMAHGPVDTGETEETGMRAIQGENIDPRSLVFQSLAAPPAQVMSEAPHSEEEKGQARERLKQIERELAEGGELDEDEFNELNTILQSKPEPVGPQYRYDDEANEWVLVKQYGQEPSFETRQVEEAPPETDDSLDVGTGVSMEENDQCCEEARTAWIEYLTQYSDTVPSIGYSWFMEDANQNCEELRASIEVWNDNNWGTDIAPTLDEIPPKILQEWDACAGQQFSGDTFTAGHGSAGVLVSKHATSPNALRHKRAYQAEYQKKPDRIKYREELIRERRKRGVYGKGGKDMSHTKQHTLVAEDPHANRARHFKGRGTLKSVGVRKSENSDNYADFQEVLQNLPKKDRYDLDDVPEDEMRAAMDAIRSKNPNINWKRPPLWVFDALVEALGPAQQARLEEKNRIAEQARQVREAQKKTHDDLVNMLAGTTETHPSPTVQAALSEMRDHIHNTTQPHTGPCRICSGNEWGPEPGTTDWNPREHCTACGYGRPLYHEGFAEEILQRQDPDYLHPHLYDMPEDAQNYQAIMQMAADKMQKSVGVRKSDNPTDSLVEGEPEWLYDGHKPSRSFYDGNFDVVNVGERGIWNYADQINRKRLQAIPWEPSMTHEEKEEADRQHEENTEKIFAEAPGNMFGRVAAHEYGHAVTADEVNDFLREKGIVGEYSTTPKATAATEHAAYTAQFPESGYLATKNMLQQVMSQVTDSFRRKQKKEREAAGMGSGFDWNTDRYTEAKERVMAELPDHLRSLYAVVQRAGRAGATLKEKEQAYREMMGARARDSMLRRQTLTSGQWPGRIAVARRKHQQ